MRVLDRSRRGFLTFFCSLALIAGPSVFVANAQGTTAPASPTAQTPKPAAKPQTATTSAPAVKPQVAAVGQKPTTPPKTEKIKEPVSAKGCKPEPGKPYFVEFRSRTAASYGHTFVFHGRLGGGNRFASFKVAGLHPKGDDPSTYIQGHWAPVAAETGVSYGDLDEQFLTARFCVVLSEAEYNKAAAHIRHLQATTKTWHAPTYNCNSFAADIAKHMGLDTPNPNAYLPETFIKRLADDNRGKRNASGAASGFSFSQWGSQPAR